MLITMDDKIHTKISKRLSYVLRHHPEAIGLKLDSQGWVETTKLIHAFQEHYFELSLEELEEVVKFNNKRRFQFSEDRQKIRASQGHSIPIDLGYEPIMPPEILFHGTATRFLLSIQKEGLKRQNRHHVHLSADEATAKNVGIRHGFPAILQIKAGEMYRNAHDFFCSENGVWLTSEVPVKYIVFPTKQ